MGVGPYKPRTVRTGHIPSKKGAVSDVHQLLQLKIVYTHCIRCVTMAHRKRLFVVYWALCRRVSSTLVRDDLRAVKFT